MSEIISKAKIADVDTDISNIGKSANELGHVNPRYGNRYKTIPQLSMEFQQAVQDALLTGQNLQQAINTALAAGAGEAGWIASLVMDSSGRNQQEINYRRTTFVTNDLVTLAQNLNLDSIFHTHGFYSSGDCQPCAFILKAIIGTETFTDIGNGILVGDDASIKISATKKLKLIANETVYLSQLGGVKTSTSTAIKNDVIASAILKNFKELVIDDFYTLRGTIWHDKNNVIRGIGKTISGIRQGDNVNKYPIQSIYSDIKQEIRLNDRLEMYGFTLDGNQEKNGVRNYTGDINQTYWGFGAALFNIDELYVHDMHVKGTEAWGISYHLCNVVHGENLTFDQAVEVGGNKDGITGSGKRVTYRNISGYTSDDLCAVGCGKSSLAGRDCGITVNQEIEYIEASQLNGLMKDGSKTHYAIGVYGPDNSIIKNVSIDGVYGDFYEGCVRIANYWRVSSNVNVLNIDIKNISKCTVELERRKYIFLNYVTSKKVIIDGINYLKNGDITVGGDSGLISRFANCVIELLSFRNVVAEQIASTQNLSLALLSTSSIRSISFENISGITSETITNDTDVNSGCFKLTELMSTVNLLTIKQCRYQGFKQFAFIKNVADMSAVADNSCIDNLLIPSTNTAYLTSASAAVTVNTSNLKIKDSLLSMDVRMSIVVSSLATDIDCFNIVMPFKLQLQRTFSPKTVSNSANFVFYNAGNLVKLNRPDFNGLTTTGTYTVSLSMQIPLV